MFKHAIDAIKKSPLVMSNEVKTEIRFLIGFRYCHDVPP